MTGQIIENYHADALESFRNYKKLAERAIEQVSDEEFFSTIEDADLFEVLEQTSPSAV